jgi:predicted MPP superfamily phosphohydrolase
LVPKSKKWIFSIAFLVLVAAFPLTEILLHEENSRFTLPFLKIGFYTMPYMLYLFILVLIFDLFLLFHLIFNWLPSGFLKRDKFRKYGALTCIVLPSLVVIYGIFNFNRIQLSEYNIEIPARSSSIQQLKIAFASDFHIGDLTRLSFIERFIDKMNHVQPDLILFGGDMLEGDRDELKTVKIEALFRNLRAQYGIYGVYGNHEHHQEYSSVSFFDQAGITILQDTFLLVDSSFYLVGRNDSRNGNRDNIENLTHLLKKDFPVLLIDHRPTDLEAVRQTHVDLQLSGHTHHGQLFPFNLITSKIYELSWGHQKIADTHFFVSSGIQLWGPPVRTIGKSEIMVIKIRFR